MSAPQSFPLDRTARWRETRLLTRALVALLGLLLLGWSVLLAPQWLRNPDLSHGLLTPVLFLFLVHEARRTPSPPFLSATPGLQLVVAAASLGGLILLGASGLYAAALGWNHALVGFVGAAGLSSLTLATWLVAAGIGVRLAPFNWPAFVAVGLWILSAPIPPGSYTRLTQALQLGVTDAVMFSLQLLGIAAERSGNILYLAHATVGIEEACSGVRSLISCIFTGFFLSAFVVRRPSHRLILIALSAPLAISMNFVRSLGLTLMAHNGIEIHGFWHDVTGFGILVVTAALLGGIALGLARSQRAVGRTAAAQRPEGSPDAGHPALQKAVAITALGGLGGAVLLAAVVVLQTRPRPRPTVVPPDIAAALPDAFEGWQVKTNEEIYLFSSQLQTNRLAQRTYLTEDAEGVVQVTVYVAYWPAGQAPVSLVASHTPDACWPGSGWAEQPKSNRRISLQVPGVSLPTAEYRLFALGDFPQHVWYWHFYGGQPVQHRGLDSPAKVLQLAWRYGFRSEGDQVFIRISSNRPWESLAGQPLLADIVHRLHPLGL